MSQRTSSRRHVRTLPRKRLVSSFGPPASGSWAQIAADLRRRAGQGLRHLAAASALRWLMGQRPCRKTRVLALLPERMLVAADRCREYTALSSGCRARLAFLIAFGVTARLTARPGCMARRTLRGTSSREKKPTFPSMTAESSLRAHSWLTQGV